MGASTNIEISTQLVVNICLSFAALCNRSLLKLQHLILWRNVIDSVKFCLCLYTVSLVGSMFNLLTLVIFLWLAAFTLPKLYLDNQALIDKHLTRMKFQLNE